MAEPVEIPFRMHRNVPFIEAEVCGRGRYAFQLDTGTNPSVIDLAVARELGLALGDSSDEGEGFGTQRFLAWETVLPRLDVGGLVVHDTAAVAIDLLHLQQVLGASWHGVLGYSFLKDRITQIDYPAKTVRFFASAAEWHAHPTCLAGKGLTLPMHLMEPDMIPEIEGAYVNGRAVRAILDTGSNRSFGLTHACSVHLGLQEACRHWPSREAHGYAGLGLIYRGRVREVIVGDVTLLEPEVDVDGDGQGCDTPLDHAGLNIGNGFLQDYVVTFDYLSRRVHLGK